MPHRYGIAAMKVATEISNITDLISLHALNRFGVFIHRWAMQYYHFSQVEALRRLYGPHDVVVRLRLDVLLRVPLTFEVQRHQGWYIHVYSNRSACAAARSCAAEHPLATLRHDASRSAPPRSDGSSLKGRLDLGVNGYFSNASNTLGPGARLLSVPSTRWIWSDWLQIGTPSSIAPLAEMTAAHEIAYSINMTVRCLGLCQEEQNALLLERRGVRLVPLRLPLTLHRFLPACGTLGLLNASEMHSTHQISEWYVPCASKKCAKVGPSGRSW